MEEDTIGRRIATVQNHLQAAEEGLLGLLGALASEAEKPHNRYFLACKQDVRDRIRILREILAVARNEWARAHPQ